MNSKNLAEGSKLSRAGPDDSIVFFSCSPQDALGTAAVKKLTSLHGTRYKVGSICNIICEYSIRASFLTNTALFSAL